MLELLANLRKLRENICYVRDVCSQSGLELVGIVKACYNAQPVIQTFMTCGVSTLGFSRVEVLPQFDSLQSAQCQLINVADPSEVPSVLQHFSNSFHSEWVTIERLLQSATRQPHGIILMVDIGDLREGLLPENVMPMVEKMMSYSHPSIRLVGLGANWGCCSGILVDSQNIQVLQTLCTDIEQRFGIELSVLTIGGSMMLDWIESHPLPSRINQVRVGEAVLLGNIPTYNKRHPDLHGDVFTFRGQVVEVKEKPSVPDGNRGLDAFREPTTLVDRGVRTRALLNFGDVDTYPHGLNPKHHKVDLITVNSDYTVVDITENETEIRVGDSLDFDVDYKAMLRAFYSPFVHKRYVDE